MATGRQELFYGCFLKKSQKGSSIFNSVWASSWRALKADTTCSAKGPQRFSLKSAVNWALVEKQNMLLCTRNSIHLFSKLWKYKVAWTHNMTCPVCPDWTVTTMIFWLFYGHSGSPEDEPWSLWWSKTSPATPQWGWFVVCSEMPRQLSDIEIDIQNGVLQVFMLPTGSQLCWSSDSDSHQPQF